MARMRAAERQEMEAAADQAMAGAASVQALGWRQAKAATPTEWTPALVGQALAEAGKIQYVLSVAGCWPAGFASDSWPEFRRLASKGDYPGDPRVRLPLPSALEITEMDRRLGWVRDYVASPVRRRLLLARAIVHPLGERPRFRWDTLAEQLGRAPRTLKSWHSKGLADVATGLEAAGEPVQIPINGTG